MNYIFNTNNSKRYTFPTHVNDLIIDRAESQTSEVFMVVLEPGQAPPLHQHSDTEQVFYVIEGNGTLSIGADKSTFAVKPGDVVRIPPSTLHSIQAQGGALRYLAVDCFVAGRPKNELTRDSHVRVNCRNNGWDSDAVTD